MGKKYKTKSYNDDELLINLLDGTFTWEQISREINMLKSSFVDKYKNKLNWTIVSLTKDELTSSFINKYNEFINWDEVCIRGHVNDFIFEKFFEELYTNTNFRYIFNNTNTSISDILLDKFSLYFDLKIWSVISQYYCNNLSFDYIDKYKDKLNWKSLCRRYNNINNEFINRFYTYKKWNNIYINRLSISNECRNIILQHKSTKSIIDEFIFDDNALRILVVKLDRQELWNYISRNCNLSSDFMKKYKNKLNLYNLKKNIYININTLKNFKII